MDTNVSSGTASSRQLNHTDRECGSVRVATDQLLSASPELCGSSSCCSFFFFFLSRFFSFFLLRSFLSSLSRFRFLCLEELRSRRESFSFFLLLLLRLWRRRPSLLEPLSLSLALLSLSLELLSLLLLLADWLRRRRFLSCLRLLRWRLPLRLRLRLRLRLLLWLRLRGERDRDLERECLRDLRAGERESARALDEPVRSRLRLRLRHEEEGAAAAGVEDAAAVAELVG